MKKVRLDQLMVQRGLAESRAKAQALIMSGVVRVAGHSHDKAGSMVTPETEVTVTETMPYVSRGGYKLAHALDVFPISPQGLIALDVGASTGGFTDVLLQRGAAHVYAVDVGYGLLDWRIRNDGRVTVLDRTNIRYLEALPLADDWEAQSAERRAQSEAQEDKKTRGQEDKAPTLQRSNAPTLAECAVIDTAFISLELVLPATQRLLQPIGWIVALIKPQFEAGPEQVGKGGVVRDPKVHARVIRKILAFAANTGLAPHGLARSPITGPAGNIEFLAWLGGEGPALDADHAIEHVLENEKR